MVSGQEAKLVMRFLPHPKKTASLQSIIMNMWGRELVLKPPHV